jgi:hypothetical protein
LADAAAATGPKGSRRRPHTASAAAAAKAESKAVWAATSPDVLPDRRRQSAKQVPGSRQGCSAEVQLARQFRDLMKNPIPGISAAPSDDDLFTWHVQVRGETSCADCKLHIMQAHYARGRGRLPALPAMPAAVPAMRHAAETSTVLNRCAAPLAV